MSDNRSNYEALNVLDRMPCERVLFAELSARN